MSWKCINAHNNNLYRSSYLPAKLLGMELERKVQIVTSLHCHNAASTPCFALVASLAFCRCHLISSPYRMYFLSIASVYAVGATFASCSCFGTEYSEWYQSRTEWDYGCLRRPSSTAWNVIDIMITVLLRTRPRSLFRRQRDLASSAHQSKKLQLLCINNVISTHASAPKAFIPVKKTISKQYDAKLMCGLLWSLLGVKKNTKTIVVVVCSKPLTFITSVYTTCLNYNYWRPSSCSEGEASGMISVSHYDDPDESGCT